MARDCCCRGAKLHCGLGQAAQRLVENTCLSALEIRRGLHCLDVEISLDEFGPLGGDALVSGIWIEQRRCEAIGAASQSAHELDEPWREFAHKDQTTDQRRTDDTKRDLGETRHHQRIGSSRVEGGWNADDCDRVASELEAIRREIACHSRGKVAETDPYGQRGHEELAILGQAKYQRDCNNHSGDGAEDAIEALGEDESTVRLRYDENGQKRPPWIVEASPECDVECEQRCRERLDRKGQSDRCLIVEPPRLFEKPAAQPHAHDSGFHPCAELRMHSEPAATMITMSTPNASASTLLVFSGPEVMCRKKTR